MYKKHNKEDILAKGEILLRTQGYHKTGINEILKASGIPKGSFYNFFESKEDFGLQVLAYYSNGIVSFIERMLKDKSRTPLERLKAFYSDLLNTNKAEECANGCLLVNMSAEMGGLSQNFAKATQKHYQEWLEIIAECVAEGQDKGEINKNYEALELADYIHSNFSGALVMMKSQRSIEPLERFYKMTFQFLQPR